MIKKSDDRIARVIAQNCQQPSVSQANGALPQFRVNDDLPDSMQRLLARLDEASRKSSTGH